MGKLTRIYDSAGKVLYVNRDEVIAVKPCGDARLSSVTMKDESQLVVKGEPTEVAFVLNNGMTMEQAGYL